MNDSVDVDDSVSLDSVEVNDSDDVDDSVMLESDDSDDVNDSDDDEEDSVIFDSEEFEGINDSELSNDDNDTDDDEISDELEGDSVEDGEYSSEEDELSVEFEGNGTSSLLFDDGDGSKGVSDTEELVSDGVPDPESVTLESISGETDSVDIDVFEAWSVSEVFVVEFSSDEGEEMFASELFMLGECDVTLLELSAAKSWFKIKLFSASANLYCASLSIE